MPTRFKIRSRGARANGAAESAVIRKPSPHRGVPDGAEVKKETAAGFNGTHDYIAEITIAWSRGGTHTLELARLVLTARRRLCYGEWTQLWKSGEMPFSKRKGEMLVVIGDRMGSIDAETFAHLPTGWSVLYWLARLERETLKKLIEEGTIHPKLRLQDAKRLATKPWSRPGKSSSRTVSVKRRLDQFRDFVERSLNNWQSKDRELARKELTRLLELIRAEADDGLQREIGNDSTAQRTFTTRRAPAIHLPQQPQTIV